MCESSAPAAPTDKQTQITELPEWARGYAKDTLAKGAALTDINQNPYQKYGGNRIAGFSPMQQQAFQGAANMQPSQQLGTATDLASAAGMGALGTNYQAGQFSNQFQAPKDYQAGRFSGGVFGQGAADYYMNPYQQSVTDIGKREAARQSAIQGTQQQGQATQAGAFGGGRDAIMRAERERNLSQQMGDIQAQGSNAAFQQAQAQFNADQGRSMQAQQAGEQSRQFGAGQGLQAASLGAQYGQSAQQLGEQSRQYGAGLGMQGLQTGLQAAGQLGQLGGQQFQQGMDINKLQSAYGGQGQQQAQRYLDQDYQDFQNQQNYPYKQLGFMSDMINRLPVGQQSTKNVYESPGSTMGQLAGLGMGAYGISQLMRADGGMVHDYAEGGVTSNQNVEGILSRLSDEQLQQAKQGALARRDVEQANMIDAEMAMRASARNGIGAGIPPEFADQMEESMATGGIVAFADKGAVVDSSKKPSPAIQSAVEKLAQQSDRDPVDLMNQTKQISDMFQKQYQPMLDKMNADNEAAKPDNEAIRQRGIGQALAQFGFKMAAAAAKPNAKFLESASSASPELADVANKTQDIMAARQKNYQDLKTKQMQYEVQLNNGNMKDATILAGQIRQQQQQDKQLAATMAHYQDQFRIQQEQLGVQRQQLAATAGRQPETIQGIAAAYMKNNPGMSFNDAMDKASKTRYGVAAEINAGPKDRAAFITGMDKINETYPPMIAKPGTRLGIERQRAIEALEADFQRGGGNGGGAKPSGGASTIMRFDAKGNPI